MGGPVGLAEEDNYNNGESGEETTVPPVILVSRGPWYNWTRRRRKRRNESRF